MPLFLVAGVFFEIFGGVLLYYSSQVNEFIYDYTDCANDKGQVCHGFKYNETCKCTINFRLSTDFQVKKD